MSPRISYLSILALLLAACGGEPDEAPTPSGPAAVKPLKQRTSKERAQRLAQAAGDILRIQQGAASPDETDRILLGLYADYLSEPPQGNEKVDAYYERLCLGPFKADCAGVFPENYQGVALKAFLTAAVAEKEELGDSISAPNLEERQVTLLNEQKPFEAFLEQVKIPKGDASLFIRVDHPVVPPTRESSVRVGVVITDKGEILVNNTRVGTKTSPFTLPSGNAPSSPPNKKALLEVLSGLHAAWEERAELEEAALQAGKTPPAGEKLAYPIDHYIELAVSPNIPAWHVAWAISVCDEAGFSNPVLVVRSTGDIPRLGNIPFPLGKLVSKVTPEPIKVKKGGEFTAPNPPLDSDTLASVYPEDGVTAQELATALDKLGGCTNNPCEIMPNVLTVERWKKD